jgi:hypothetical protein
LGGKVKFFDSRVIESLKSSQLLRPKDQTTEAPAEATIQAVLPVLSDHDSKGSDEGSDRGPGKAEGGPGKAKRLDGNAPGHDGDNDPGFGFLPDEKEGDDNNDSHFDGSLPPHRIEIGSPKASDDEESDGNNNSVDGADNVLKEDELEPKIDDDDDEVDLNHFEVEDLNNHGMKW